MNWNPVRFVQHLLAFLYLLAAGAPNAFPSKGVSCLSQLGGTVTIDSRYGRARQDVPMLVETGARPALGRAVMNQCVTTGFVNILTKIRAVRGLKSPFKSPYEELAFIVGDFPKRVGREDLDLTRDGLYSYRARELYQSYFNSMAIPAKIEFYERNFEPYWVRNRRFPIEELNKSIQENQAIELVIGRFAKGRYQREITPLGERSSHALIVVGTDTAAPDRFILRDPLSKRDRIARIRPVWIKAANEKLYRVEFENLTPTDPEYGLEVFLTEMLIFKF